MRSPLKKPVSGPSQTFSSCVCDSRRPPASAQASGDSSMMYGCLCSRGFFADGYQTVNISSVYQPLGVAALVYTYSTFFAAVGAATFADLVCLWRTRSGARGCRAPVATLGRN